MAVTWKTVRQSVISDDRGKFDLLVTPGLIEWVEDVEDLYLKVNGVGTFMLSEWAESQLCAKLGVPTRYFRRSPGDFKRIQLEYWIRRNFKDDDRWLLRCKGSVIRGVLSDHYQPFDNHRFIELWEGLGISSEFNYHEMLTDVSFHLRAIPKNGRRKNDGLGGLMAGVYIGNSEVGRRGMSVQATVWRLICSNGMIGAVDSPSFYHRHIWIDELEVARRFKEAVSAALDESRSGLHRMAAATAVPATEEDLLFALGETAAAALDGHGGSFAMNSFRSGGQMNLFGVVNAMTSLARHLPADERYDLERRAGKLLERRLTADN